MKKALVLLLLFIVANTFGQSRIYVAGGISTSIGGNITTTFAGAPAQLSVDIEWQKKVAGSISFATGLSTFGTAYTTNTSSFGSQSNYKATYIAVPLLIRWNMGNKNIGYLDFGLQPQFLASAHLQESIDKFGTIKNAEGDITAYSNRLYIATKFQYSILINRLLIGLYIITPFTGQQSVKGLQDHWALNQQQSTYLLANGYSDYWVFGIRAGVRLK
jgi:hypothetical protein